ncbi:hypothetical protein CRYUN_Cryun18bG0085400 [Craigia yunnanensis]
MGVLQWLPFWPHIKLSIFCWLMIPHFDGAFYVYYHFVHPCLYMDVQTIINWFKKQQEFFLEDNFLVEADKYVKAHGPEALEKLISSESKGTELCILQKDIKPVQVAETWEVAPVNLIPETEPDAAQTVNNMITPPEIKGAASCDPPEIPSDRQVQKEWTCAMCQVTTSSEKTLNSHLQGRRHWDAYEELMKAKNQPSKGKVSFASAVGVKNSDLPSNNTSTSSKAVNPKTGTSKSNQPKKEPKKSLPNNVAGNQLKPSEKVQGQRQAGKKHAEIKIPRFQCTICNISCGCSEDLNCHLWGKKHLARIQELNSLGTR